MTMFALEYLFVHCNSRKYLNKYIKTDILCFIFYPMVLTL